MFKTEDKIKICGTNFSVKCVESSDRTDLFTPSHTKFNCTLTVKGKKLNFPYQCNLTHSEPEAKDIVYCLLNDSNCIDSTRDLADFLCEFGYTDGAESIRKGNAAYKACLETHNFFKSVFTDDELAKLYAYFENY